MVLHFQEYISDDDDGEKVKCGTPRAGPASVHPCNRWIHDDDGGGGDGEYDDEKGG